MTRSPFRSFSSSHFSVSAFLASQTHKDKVDLLVTGGTVVTMDGTRKPSSTTAPLP